MNNNICPKCHTSVEEILETGFVGCEKCYELPEIKQAVDRMYKGKKHKSSEIQSIKKFDYLCEI